MMVFISHSFEDAPKFDELSEVFSHKGLSFFRPSTMHAGRSLAEQLRESINSCTLCILSNTQLGRV